MIIHLNQATLRPPEQRDGDDVLRQFSDFEIVSRLRQIPWPADRQFATDFNDRSIAKWQTPEGLSRSWVIEVAGQHSGMIHASHQQDQGDGVFSLGYWLDRHHWGHGIMSDAVQAIVDHCFTEAGAQTIVAGVLADNPASGHILQKQGFAIIGVEETHFMALGQMRPYVHYRLLRDDWEGRQ